MIGNENASCQKVTRDPSLLSLFKQPLIVKWLESWITSHFPILQAKHTWNSVSISSENLNYLSNIYDGMDLYQILMWRNKAKIEQTVVKLTMGTPNQSSAAVMAWRALSSASSGFMVYASGHRPGALASTRSATAIPSFQSVVRLVTFFCGIQSWNAQTRMEKAWNRWWSPHW